jgi:hypothetical protein
MGDLRKGNLIMKGIVKAADCVKSNCTKWNKSNFLDCFPSLKANFILNSHTSRGFNPFLAPLHYKDW